MKAIRNHCFVSAVSRSRVEAPGNYPNRYLGQYLTCVRLGALPACMFALAAAGLGGGGETLRLSLLLSAMVKPRSLLSFRLIRGRKWVETC